MFKKQRPLLDVCQIANARFEQTRLETCIGLLSIVEIEEPISLRASRLCVAISSRMSGQNGNASAVAHAERGCDLFSEDKLDALTINERKQTIVVLAHVTVDFAHCGKLNAFGLLHVEDIGIAEANKNAGILLGNVLLGFHIGLAFDQTEWHIEQDVALDELGCMLVICRHATCRVTA